MCSPHSSPPHSGVDPHHTTPHTDPPVLPGPQGHRPRHPNLPSMGTASWVPIVQETLQPSRAVSSLPQWTAPWGSPTHKPHYIFIKTSNQTSRQEKNRFISLLRDTWQHVHRTISIITSRISIPFCSIFWRAWCISELRGLCVIFTSSPVSLSGVPEWTAFCSAASGVKGAVPRTGHWGQQALWAQVGPGSQAGPSNDTQWTPPTPEHPSRPQPKHSGLCRLGRGASCLQPALPCWWETQRRDTLQQLSGRPRSVPAPGDAAAAAALKSAAEV